MGQNPNLEEIDSEIREIVTLFNNYAYIQTIGSCSGHYLWECQDIPLYHRVNDYCPWVYYQLLGIEAYSLTHKLIDDVGKRRRQSDFLYPIAELREGDKILFSARAWVNKIPSEKDKIREGILRFLNDLESILKEYIQHKI